MRQGRHLAPCIGRWWVAQTRPVEYRGACAAAYTDACTHKRRHQGKTLLHVTCATVRQVGQGCAAKASNLRVTGGLSALASSQPHLQAGRVEAGKVEASGRASMSALASTSKEGGREAQLDTVHDSASHRHTSTATSTSDPARAPPSASTSKPQPPSAGGAGQAGLRDGIALEAASLSQSLSARWGSKGSEGGHSYV